MVQADFQIGQQRVQGRLVVQRDHHVIPCLGHHPDFGYRFAALGYAGNQIHLRPKGHAAHATAENTLAATMARQRAVAGQRKLHAAAPAAGQAAKQVTAFGAPRHVAQQLGDIGGGRVHMQQRGLRLKPQIQRRDTGEHAELVARYFQQHDRQRWLVEILHIGRGNTNSYGTGPVRNSR